MKRVLTVVIIALSLLFSSYKPGQSHSYTIRTVVIDAGHGGHDTGCNGGRSKEKDVALGIALKLGNYIEKNFTDIKVIYTRKTDTFVELRERAAIANNNKADVFICIHCNSGPKEAFGTETYVMGLHKTLDNLSVAKRENSSILMEDNYQTKYDGFDPNSPEANIIFSLYQNAFMEQSLILASKIQKDFRDQAGRYNRGVKQAGFLVLYRTTMPSILIETGFLTNPSEEKFLSTQQGQDYIASSIFRAFKEYKVESEGVVIQKVAADNAKQATAATAARDAAIPSTNTKKKPVPATQTPAPSPQPNKPAPQNQPASTPPQSAAKPANQIVSPPIVSNVTTSGGASTYASDRSTAGAAAQQHQAGTPAPKKEPLSINVDAPKVPKPKKTAADSASRPMAVSGTAGTGTSAAISYNGSGPGTYIVPVDSTKEKPKQPDKKPTKPVDPEILARAADRAEFETQRKNKLAEEKIRKDAAARLKKEIEERVAVEKQQMQKDAIVLVKTSIEQEKKKKEEQAKIKAEQEQKSKADYEQRVKTEMDRMRAQAEQDYARKIATEKAKIIAEAKQKMAEGALQNGTPSNEPLTPEQEEEKKLTEQEIKQREAKARAIAMELTKKNGNVKPYINEKKKNEEPEKKTNGAEYKDDPALLTSKTESPSSAILDVQYIDRDNAFYGVQIVNSQKAYNMEDQIFKGLKAISVDKAPDGNYKYIYGKVFSFSEAVALQKQMRDKGYKDAFVVAYSGGHRITMQEARAQIKESEHVHIAVPYEADGDKRANEAAADERMARSDKYSSEFVNLNAMRGLIFTVQVATSPTFVSLTSPIFKGLTQDINRDLSETPIRYTVGVFKSFDEANEFRKGLKSKGFPDAFVAAYKNGQKISVDEARLLTK